MNTKRSGQQRANHADEDLVSSRARKFGTQVSYMIAEGPRNGRWSLLIRADRIADRSTGETWSTRLCLNGALAHGSRPTDFVSMIPKAPCFAEGGPLINPRSRKGCNRSVSGIRGRKSI